MWYLISQSTSLYVWQKVEFLLTQFYIVMIIVIVCPIACIINSFYSSYIAIAGHDCCTDVISVTVLIDNITRIVQTCVCYSFVYRSCNLINTHYRIVKPSATWLPAVTIDQLFYVYIDSYKVEYNYTDLSSLYCNVCVRWYQWHRYSLMLGGISGIDIKWVVADAQSISEGPNNIISMKHTVILEKIM